MIRVRIDDVMCKSSAYDRKECLKRIEKVFRWLSQGPGKIQHVPTILITEIQEWPEVVELVKDYTLRGLCAPQLHGYEHVDYGKLSVEDITTHIDKSMEWFYDNLGYEPTVWATPWGACNHKMVSVARAFDIKLETTHGTITPGAAIKILRKGGSLEGTTIMEHWWKKGLNLIRLVEIVRAGSYDKAVEERGDLFDV